MNNIKKLIGHTDIFNNLMYLHNKKKLPKKILLSGQKGIGKSLLVNKFLNEVYNESKSQTDFDKLIKNNIHPNIFTIDKEFEKKNIDINQVRDMIKFLSHSSFNNKEKFVFIKNAESLNANSANALLKSLEEPTNNSFFLITYDPAKKIQDTIKSRCLEFKLSLTNDEVKLIVDQFFNDNIYNQICEDYINYYNSPSFLISLVMHIKELKYELYNFYIEDLLKETIKNKHYVKNSFIKDNLNFFIELYFYKNINKSNNLNNKLRNYFYIKFSEIKKFNLDLESFFLEFEDKLLSE